MADFNNEYIDSQESNDKEFKDLLFRYINFWPYFLTAIIFSLIIAFIYLRYAEYNFMSVSKIEILDSSQDREMALPTAMTIFNRSMVNLENEMGILNSYSLHSKVVNKLRSNIKFYTKGRIKTSLNHAEEWFDDYEFTLVDNNFDVDSAKEYEINISLDGMLTIDSYLRGELVKSYLFSNLSTENDEHDLPFNLKINHKVGDMTKIIRFYPFESTVKDMSNRVIVKPSGKDSDQLDLSLTYPNIKLAEEYINTLMYEFDRDGIVDRQLEYKNTIDFVDTRAKILSKELEQIELRKQNFKRLNNLSDLKFDASTNIQEKFEYSNELFANKSQLDLLSIIEESLVNDDYKSIPMNIGLESPSLDIIISDFNKLVRERDKFLVFAGPNNSNIISIENQLKSLLKNISLTIDNYKKNLEINIVNLSKKENEFQNVYSNVPENEKILRSIERQLSVKEALFVLLLQKREEAAINFAVVKPSLKVVDMAKTSSFPVSPNRILIYLISFLIGFLVPFSIIFLRLYFNNKIHTRKDLTDLTKNFIPIIGEIPHVKDDSIQSMSFGNSRTPFSESIRMIVANLNFTKLDDQDKNNVILVTSTIKGEGKTLISTNLASIMSSTSYNVLLIGADLRNPQIHKYLDIDKSKRGLSDYIYMSNLDWKELLVKKDNLHILLSGKIPPNPTQLLTSEKFKLFLNDVKKKYDYVVIDSAPCLLVSDTFEISKHVGTTVYAVRSNYSNISLTEFIIECNNNDKLNNMNLVLNGVGDSKAYGYKYSYQYGYQYGYKYSYNYGYGYGYEEDKK